MSHNLFNQFHSWARDELSAISEVVEKKETTNPRDQGIACLFSRVLWPLNTYRKEKNWNWRLVHRASFILWLWDQGGILKKKALNKHPIVYPGAPLRKTEHVGLGWIRVDCSVSAIPCSWHFFIPYPTRTPFFFFQGQNTAEEADVNQHRRISLPQTYHGPPYACTSLTVK